MTNTASRISLSNSSEKYAREECGTLISQGDALQRAVGLTSPFRPATSGFTLVETLVAITLLLLVIVGPMSIASRGIQNAYYAGDQTTATFLAQEAIEHIQGLRDDNALQEAIEFQSQGNNNDDDVWTWYDAGGDWDVYCKAETGCDIDFDSGNYRDCATQSRCQLQKYTGNSAIDRIFAYQTVGPDWSDSPFTRVIRIGDVITSGGEPVAVPVSVTVSWESSLFGGTRDVVLQTYLYNLYSRFE